MWQDGEEDVAGRYCKLLDSVFLISGPAARVLASSNCSLVDRMARIVISNYQCHQGRQNLKDQSSRILQRILPEFHTQ